MAVKHFAAYPRRMSSSYEQVNFRMPTELRDRLREAAEANNRSVTAELVHRLEQSFAIADSPEKEIHLSRQQFDSLMESMRDQIAEHLAWSPEALERFKGAKK